ncbi:Uncharacterised protein [Sphingobacterium daejeonense]|nr:Uncharacterised protein [Sphingobacterium daejeonense]
MTFITWVIWVISSPTAPCWGDKGYLSAEIQPESFRVLQHQAGYAQEKQSKELQTSIQLVQKIEEKDRDIILADVRPIYG